MNNERRKLIARAIATIEKLGTEIEFALETLEEAKSEEEEAYEAMPESLQSNERGQSMQSAIENLQSAIDQLEEWRAEDVVSSLEEARA